MTYTINIYDLQNSVFKIFIKFQATDSCCTCCYGKDFFYFQKGLKEAFFN